MANTETVLIRMPTELRERIGEWRSQRRPIPSEAEAIRCIVRDALSPEPTSSLDDAQPPPAGPLSAGVRRMLQAKRSG